MWIQFNQALQITLDHTIKRMSPNQQSYLHIWKGAVQLQSQPCQPGWYSPQPKTFLVPEPYPEPLEHASSLPENSVVPKETQGVKLHHTIPRKKRIRQVSRAFCSLFCPLSSLPSMEKPQHRTQVWVRCPQNLATAKLDFADLHQRQLSSLVEPSTKTRHLPHWGQSYHLHPHWTTVQV